MFYDLSVNFELCQYPDIGTNHCANICTVEPFDLGHSHYLNSELESCITI